MDSGWTRTHLCDRRAFTTEQLKEIILGSKRRTDDYKCAGCSKSFQTICVLHYHCMEHSDGGSFFFDHVTRTAYPKCDSTCSYTQIDNDLLGDYFNEETILADDVKVLGATAREINQHPLYIRTKTKVENIFNSTCISEENDTEVAESTTHSINIGDRADCSSKDNISIDEFKLENSARNEIKAANDKEASVKDSQVRLTNKTRKSKRLMNETDSSHRKASSPRKDVIRMKGNRRNSEAVYSQMKVASKKNEEKDKDSLEFAAEVDRSININTDQVDVRMEKSSLNTSVFDLPTSDKGETAQDTKSDTIAGRKRGRPVKRKLAGDGLGKKSRNSDKLAKHLERNDVKQKLESVEEEMTGNRRSSRKRKVSSRLKDTEWETPKQQLMNNLSNVLENADVTEKQDKRRDYKISKAILKQKVDDVKAEIGGISTQEKEFATNILEKETAEASSTSTETGELATDFFEKETDKIDLPVEEHIQPEISEKTEECSEITTDTTCPADISASEVLLSLSKTKDDTQLDSTESTVGEKNETPKSVCKAATKAKSKGKHKKYSEYVTNTDKHEPKVRKKRGIPLSKRKDLKCETCGKVGTAAMIKYHEECHSSEKPYICEVCGKGYKTRGCLVAHSHLHGERKFKCDQCPATFYRRQYWKAHLLIHADEYPHRCHICDKGFRESYILKRHIKHVHENVRDFECDICHLRFFRPETRDNHRIRHFDPTMKCQYCPKLFKADLDRKKHELTHTGEKQYFCPKCSSGFSQLWPYYRHMWKKHNISKDEAKKIKIKNENMGGIKIKNENIIGGTKNIHEEQAADSVENAEPSDQQVIQFNIVEKVENGGITEGNNEGVNIIYENSITSEDVESVVPHGQDDQIIIQPNDRLVTQCNEEVVVHSGEDMVIQSGAQIGNEIYDHLYVSDPSNVTIQVLTADQQLEEGTVIMETREENPDTGDVSIIQQNIVILSEYPEFEGTYTELDGYTKEYSVLDI